MFLRDDNGDFVISLNNVEGFAFFIVNDLVNFLDLIEGRRGFDDADIAEISFYDDFMVDFKGFTDCAFLFELFAVAA